MAALFLAVAGAAAGGSVLGPLGAIFRRLVGAVAGIVGCGSDVSRLANVR